MHHGPTSFRWIIAALEGREIPPDPTLIGIEHDLSRVGLAEELEDLGGRLAANEMLDLVERSRRPGCRESTPG